MEVYVNDMLVKSVKEDDHITNLEKAFNNLRCHHMRLNPSKCLFGITAKKFFGFMVTQ